MATFAYLLWALHRTTFGTFHKSKANKPDGNGGSEGAQCRQTESRVFVEEPKQIYNNRSVNMQIEEGRQESTTLSGGNWVISPIPSSTCSTSNDMRRQDSVYPAWADSELSFPAIPTCEVMEINDNYPSGTVTCPTLDNTQFVSLADPKSYSEILEEENDFSISLSSGLQGSLPVNHTHNSGDGTGTNLKRELNEETLDDLTQSYTGSQSVSTSAGLAKRRRLKSPVVESVIYNKIESSVSSGVTQGHSRMTSNNDEQQNDDEDSGDGKLEVDDEEEADEEPVPKKKKKGPVVIHDHITILGGDPVMYQCNFCNKKFKTKGHIKYHGYCEKGNKPFQCETCGKGFIAKSHYESHLRTHTGERPYICPKCGKGFNQRAQVTRHMRTHTGERPFVCQECNSGFANAQALRTHALSHAGERPFACTYCNERFKGMTNLKKHVLTHTGERPFSCKHCDKSFGLKWTLDLHLRTHTSERPYPCDQCLRAFSNSKDLRRHLVIHSGERPFQCLICQTAFRRKDNLDRHIKNTHNQPKEIANQLANEAASEYLKNNSKRFHNDDANAQ